MRSPKKTGSLCHSLQSMTTPQRIDCSKIEWEQKDQKTNYITLTFHQGKMILGYTKKEKNHEREKEYSFSPSHQATGYNKQQMQVYEPK